MQDMWKPVDQFGAWLGHHHRLLWAFVIAGAAALAWAVKFGWI